MGMCWSGDASDGNCCLSRSGMAKVTVKGRGLWVLPVVPGCEAGEAAAGQGLWQTEGTVTAAHLPC